ncbi:hypothetical protein D8S78_13150 [Natrialba swarupiae]|nr:hypothetical protein [Natrialba swarupiae]
MRPIRRGRDRRPRGNRSLRRSDSLLSVTGFSSPTACFVVLDSFTSLGPVFRIAEQRCSLSVSV